MKIRCDRSEMVEKLGVIAGIVPAASPKPILRDFLLRTKEGCLLAEANDLEVAGRIRVERVEVMQDGALSLPAARLVSILREVPDGASGVSLEETADPRGAVLRADGYEFKLLGDDPEEFPSTEEVEPRKSIDLPADLFVHSLRRVAIAASRDPTRYQLGGVFFEVGKGKLTLTATDGKRLTNDLLKVEDGQEKEFSAIVPNRAVDVILKMLAGAAGGEEGEKFTLGFTDTEVLVRTSAGQLNARLIEGTYPNYRNAFPPSLQVKAKVNRADLLHAAKSAQLMTDEQTATVVFRFEADRLNIWSQAKDIGETRIRIKAEVEQGPFEIRFNPSYLVDALRCLDEEEVRIEFQSPDRPGVLKGGTHYRHLIMPLVVEGP